MFSVLFEECSLYCLKIAPRAAEVQVREQRDWREMIPPGSVTSSSPWPAHWWASLWSLHSLSPQWTSARCTLCGSACHLWTRTGGTSDTSDTWCFETKKTNKQENHLRHHLDSFFLKHTHSGCTCTQTRVLPVWNWHHLVIWLVSHNVIEEVQTCWRTK